MMESGYVNTNIKTNTNTNTNKSVHLVNKCGGSGRSPRQSSAIPRNISHRKGFCQCYPGWYGTTCSVSCPRCSQAIPGTQRTRKATGTLGFLLEGRPESTQRWFQGLLSGKGSLPEFGGEAGGSAKPSDPLGIRPTRLLQEGSFGCDEGREGNGTCSNLSTPWTPCLDPAD